MNTDKKKDSSFSAEALTSEEVRAILKKYVDSLNALDQEEPPGKLTPEEWDEAFREIERTGEIPAKYKGRIGKNEIKSRVGMEPLFDESGKPLLDDKGEPRFKLNTYNTPKKKGVYYDIAEAAHDKKGFDLQAEYYLFISTVLKANYEKNKDAVLESLKAYLTTGEDGSEDRAAEIAEILAHFLAKPLEKKSTLAPISSVPNGEIVNWLFRVLSGIRGGRIIGADPANRHEEITATRKGNKITFTRKNKESGSTVTVTIDQADNYLKKTNKTFKKVLLFTLQKMTAQNFPLEIGFSLQELVDLGIYYDTSTARRAVKDFFEQQKLTTLSGTVKKGKTAIKEEGGILFYHYKIDNNFVTLFANENLNMEFIATYFTIFPRFAYALSNNAFSLVRYIFFLARQNTQAIKEKETFKISLEAVRESLGLPSVDEVKHRKYRDKIIEPIEGAIEEIEEALSRVPEAKEYGFTITPCGSDSNNIREWLQGYLEIGLKGDFAETFVKIATKAEEDRAQWEKVKQAELARIAARSEAKEAQGGTTGKRKGRKKAF